MNLGVMGATAALLVCACWTDLRRLRIPNGLTAGFAMMGFGYHAVAGGWAGIGFCLSGAAAGMLPLWILYRFRGIGGGDVKWFGAFGIWTGTAAALQLLFYSVLIAGAISAVLLLWRLPGIRRAALRIPWPWGDHPAEAGRKTSFPFMLAIAPGFVMLACNLGIAY